VSLKWKYLVVVHAATITVAALLVVLRKLAGRLDEELIHVAWAGGMVAALSVILLAAYASFVSDPLRRVVEGAERLAAGERGHRIDIRGGDELAHLAAAINRMAERIGATHDELEAQVQERTADLRAVLGRGSSRR
jgi:nitrate/nitrite-specific signal transduction histidine kinase